MYVGDWEITEVNSWITELFSNRPPQEFHLQTM